MDNPSKRLRPLLATMSPGYFALVMSTGIISLACHFMGKEVLALALFGLNLGFYLILWCLTLLRLACYPREMASDLASPARSVGFFTLIAATCLVGSQCLLLVQAYAWGLFFLALGAALEVFFLYAVFAALISRPAKPPFAAAINGSWLLITVSLQSLAILACLVSARMPPWQEPLLSVSLSLFLLGFLFYLPVITLILYRLWFLDLDPQAFEPPYWITAGADAITTLAGAVLVAHGQGLGPLQKLSPFVLGITALAWSTATFWIPLVLILMIWRHGLRRVPLAYSPAYWGMVFPLGMYSACTWYFAGVVGPPALQNLARAFVYIALIAWSLTLVGMCRFALGFLLSPRTVKPE